MKLNHTLKLAGLLVCFFTAGQLPAQNADPFNTLSAERLQAIQILALDNASVSLAADVRVNAFLAANPGMSRTEVDANGIVYYISDVVDGLPRVLMTHNANAASTISVNKLLPGGSSGLNLTGSGVIVGVWDGGDGLPSHQEFFSGGTSRLIDKDGFSGASQHAMHVCGTIGALGTVGSAKGMATASTVHLRYFSNPGATMPTAVVNDGIKVSNHSYGYQHGWGVRTVSGLNYWAWYGDTTVSETEDSGYGFYSDYAQEVDRICYTAKGYLPVWSAGNERGGQGQGPAGQPVGHYANKNGTWEAVFDKVRANDYDLNAGFDLLSDHGVAKNNLVVAAVEDLTTGYVPANGAGQVSASTFTSYGPPDDGRVKPDLAANGVDVYSTDVTGTTAYATLSGTSMASPTVAGSGALTIQRYIQLYGSANDLLSSTLKAIFCHTADEAGAAAGPDYRFGWGLLNTNSAVALLNQHQGTGTRLTHIKQVILKNGGTVEFVVTAVGGSTPLKVTLCWTDPAGTVPTKALDANVASLVNDLDLRLIRGATTHYPWKLNPTAHTAAATNTSDNNRDTVETVLVPTPTAGNTYTVRVTHKGTLINDTGATAPQQLSLVLTGVQDTAEPEFKVTSIAKVANTNDYDITWNSVVGGLYELETSATLQNGSWTAVVGSHSAVSASTTTRVTSGEERRFWRVKRTK